MPRADLRCPGGHALPREGCTPVYCLDQRGKKGGTGVPKKSRKAGSSRDTDKVSATDSPQTVARKTALRDALAPLGDVPPTDGQAQEASKLSVLAGRYAARLGVSKTPQDLKGGDAEEYAAKKLVEMLPAAVHEVEHQLKFGDDKQRMDAARDVLDANGMRRKEQVGNMVPPIVLNFTGVLPWMQQEKTLTPTGDAAVMKKVQLHAQVVDGEASRRQDGESGADGDGPRWAAEADGGRGQAT